MDRFERVNSLIPFYESLLTDRQREILNYYYSEDLSLSEISENLSISRNAVHDAIKKAVALLEEYEDKLHLEADYRFRMEQYARIKEKNDPEINSIVDSLIQKEEQ